MLKLYLNPKAAEEMFTPDTPKRTQIAACMKIVGCFLEKSGISGKDVVALKKVNQHEQEGVA